MKKKLTLARAVEAAGILFELNSTESGVLAMARKACLPCETVEEKSRLMLEWRAFVHAAVLYGLMVQAPNVVVVEYLRATQDMLGRLGYSPAEAEAFVDGAFRSYVDPMVRTKTQECPAVFFERLLGRKVEEVPQGTAAMVSAVMAMILSAVLDKLEQYEFGLE
ncbi:hypothetical protein [Mailhella massiliensis]|uniref:Uncharacterized protein n=1 Tax=Mailhella massiliensis TaxID=1903261 RepID=A0A921AWN5_9BACT|nr:hypothetical protein [Mailhella massiliensis]HJD97707.1 hypothetical protein [Mailhella massiliensis]